jgi:hypothetical protein
MKCTSLNQKRIFAALWNTDWKFSEKLEVAHYLRFGGEIVLRYSAQRKK